MVFLDEQQNLIQPISGYLVPERLEPILAYFGSNAYKDTDWDTYYKNFKSNISQ
jgi:thioredoxin-related protein